MRRGLLSLAAWAASKLPERVRLGLYHLGPVTQVIRRCLTLAAPSGEVDVEVAGGLLQGVRLSLDMQTEKDAWLGNYEPDLLAALRILTPEGGTAYDVGANIGLICLGLAAWVGPQGRVLAFEPLPDNLRRLENNLRLNESGRRVTVIPAAVGSQAGEAEFLVHESGGMGKLGGSAGRQAAYAHRLKVPVVRLDDTVFEEHAPVPDVIKIDVEGGEGMVLSGAERLLDVHRPVLMLELHGPEAAGQVWQILNRHGYQVRQLSRGYPVVTRPEELGWKAYVAAGIPAVLEARLA